VTECEFEALPGDLRTGVLQRRSPDGEVEATSVGRAETGLQRLCLMSRAALESGHWMNGLASSCK
jgi:hypothetical protein